MPQTPEDRRKLEQDWIKEFFVFGCFLSAHEARVHYEAHNKASDPLLKKLHYTNLHTALAVSYETLGAVLIGMSGYVKDKDFLGHFLAYKPGQAYVSKMLKTMATPDELCKNYGIDKAAILKHKLPADELDKRLQNLVDDTPKVAREQDRRSTFYNKTKHGTAIVDSEKGPYALFLENRDDWRSEFQGVTLGYDAKEARVFYNDTVRICLMLADLMLLHYLSRYDTGYDELKTALKLHDAIVSIVPEQ